jgi:putative heme-binding domain-containing protein
VKSRDFFDSLFQSQPDARDLAIRGLADVGPQLAAKRAVEFLSQVGTAEAAAPVIGAFLRNKQLPNALAKELEGKTIPEAAAVEGIRMASTRAVQGPLIEALKKAGKVRQMDRPLTPEEMGALVAKVKAQGDASRGERVYRRQSLLCQTCHAIGAVGGMLGPDLVSIGASAPVDYLIESLLEPSKKVKEGYHMIVVNTTDGQIVSGGLVQDGQDEVVIRDPANQMHKVPKAKIASRQISPVSMMPPGLTASLREDEFVDLVRFLSELGREGAYKIKPNRYVRTWKTMGAMTQEQIDHVRHVGLHTLNDPAYPFPWEPRLSLVDGSLPLEELTVAAKMYPWFPKIAQFEVQAEPGIKELTIEVEPDQGLILAVNQEVIKQTGSKLTVSLLPGRNLLTVLVPKEIQAIAHLRVTLN